MSLCFGQVQYQTTDIFKCKKTAKNYMIFFSGSDETNMVGTLMNQRINSIITTFWKDYVKIGSKNYSIAVFSKQTVT